MRLGTLARKISITPSKLTAFLESQKIELPSGTNTKLTEEHIALILEHFQVTLEPEIPEEAPVVEMVEEPTAVTKPEEEEKVEVQAAVEEPEIKEEDKIEEVDQKELVAEVKETSDEIKPPEEEIVKSTKSSNSFAEIALPHELEESESLFEDDHTEIETVVDEMIEDEIEEAIEEEEEYIPQIPDDLDPEIESYVERLAYDKNIKVIKPPKVKLQGLTVKGKIDLPEPKVETETIEEPKEEKQKAYNPDEIITTTGPNQDRKRKPKNYKGKKFNKDYNPVESARRKKEWEEKKRIEQEEKRKKKAKEKHYKKIAKPVATAPVAKKKPKKVLVKKKQQQQKPTGNMLQRFWRWMNT